MKPRPYNVIELPAPDLNMALKQGPRVLSNKQMNQLVQDAVKYERKYHLRVLQTWTTTHCIDWNAVIGNLTLFGHAVRHELVTSIKELLKFPDLRPNQGGINNMNPWETSPIRMSIVENKLASFTILVNNPRIDVNTYFKQGDNVILHTIENTDPRYLEQLVRRRDLDIHGLIGDETPISIAIQKGSVKHLTHLMISPHFTRTPTLQHYSPIAEAVLEGWPNLVRLLLQHGANPKETMIPSVTNQAPMDMYSANIHLCNEIHGPNDATNRLMIGEILLGTSARPALSHQQLVTLFEAHTEINEAPEACQEITLLRHRTAIQLINRLSNSVPAMTTLAKDAIIKELQSTAEGRHIKQQIAELEASCSIPWTCTKILNS